MLDVGASNGSWSRACMPFFPEAKFVLFEPQGAHDSALTEFERSNLERVTVKRAAVGGESGTTYFVADDPFSGALASSAGCNTVKVPVTTLDDAASELNLDGPFLMKLDTHGFEIPILDGAGDVLRRTAALIIESYWFRLREGAPKFWELCRYLESRGFQPVDCLDPLYREHDGALWQVDQMFLASSWRGFEHSAYR